MQLFLTFCVASWHCGGRNFPRTLRGLSTMSQVPPKKIAVIGGGISGLALTRELCRTKNINITLFDPAKPGQSFGASSVAAGIFHALSPRGKVMWKGLEGVAATHRLIEEAQEALPNKRIICSSTVIQAVISGREGSARFSMTGKQKVSQERLHEELNGYIPPKLIDGTVIENACVVDTQAYMLGLWNVCEQSGATWSSTPISRLSEVFEQPDSFDAVVVAAGAGIRFIPELKSFCESKGVFFSRGQCVDIPNSHGLKCALASGGEYIAPIGSRLVIGASHEQFTYEEDRKVAGKDGGEITSNGLDQPALPPQEVFDKYLSAIESVWPPVLGVNGKLRQDELTATLKGVRVTSRRSHLGSLPMAGKWEEGSLSRSWLFTGLGSRGLLYHALLAQYLSQAVLCDDERKIPVEFRIPHK